ncbi:MAG: GGDEF domain-containing protein [Parcubacteria group bacterium]|jgi:diguanylate cyclase (GGDEF)-like protein
MNKKALQSQIALLVGALLQVTEENENLRKKLTNTEILRKRLANAEKNARTDNLTGIGNRLYAVEAVDRLKSLAGRKQLVSSLVCVAFIDMDNLKKINDTHGHATGSNALLALVGALKKATRTNDIIARIGGDEFIIVGLFKDRKEINVFKKRVEAALCDVSIEETAISTSIGYCYTRLDSKFNFEKILKIADERMYKAKTQKKK